MERDLQGQREDTEHSVIVREALPTGKFQTISFLAELSALSILAVEEPFLSRWPLNVPVTAAKTAWSYVRAGYLPVFFLLI